MTNEEYAMVTSIPILGDEDIPDIDIPDDDFDSSDVGNYLGDGRNAMGCFCTKSYMCGECQYLEDAIDRAQQRQIDKGNED